MKRDRDEARCREPLPLDPIAQKAFADRQAKLLDDERWKWPLRNWYNDEDFCRAYNTAVGLLAKVEGLQSIVDELPKTADGVPVVRGMTLWEPLHLTAFHVDSLEAVCKDTRRSEWVTNDYIVDLSQCYSTRKAAEEKPSPLTPNP